MLQENVSLKQFSNYKIGGSARYFFHAKGLADLRLAVKIAQKENLPVFILGGGTNLVINDNGFQGFVIKPDIKFITNLWKSDFHRLVYVGAGVLIADLLNFCVEKGLSGLEWAGGLPGTVGGAIRGNAGAFGGEIKDLIVDVSSIKHQMSGEMPIIIRTKEECGFEYRNSLFKKNPGEIILGATLQLKSGDPKIIRQLTDEKIAYRHQKHPIDYPNVGSIFKNVDWSLVPDEHKEKFQHKVKQDPFPVLPTAILVDRCGLRGVAYGGAMISPKHPNFIVNVMDASAGDVKQLIELVKNSVWEKFGIKLEEEVQYV